MEGTPIIVVTVCTICAYDRPADVADQIIVWSNFEIGDLDFWRGETYMKFFEFLDSKGGFYYEVRTRHNSRKLPTNTYISVGEMHLYIV